MSKGYTINFFVQTLTNTTARQVGNTTASLYAAVAPRAGGLSVKSIALDTWLDNRTTAIVTGEGRFANYGKTTRARVLKALRNRKNTGAV